MVWTPNASQEQSFPLVAVCGGISWAASSLVVTLVGLAGLIGEEMTNLREYFI